MDYEKMIERLNNHLQSLTAYSDPELAHTLEDAATLLSTLQSEAEGMRSNWYKSVEEIQKLRAEVEMWKCRCKEAVNHASELDIALYDTEAKLEQVKHQRDSYRLYHDDLASKPNCNTCADKDCKYRPIPGDTVRANCPLWRGSEEGEQDG